MDYEELVKGLREHAERFNYDGWIDTAIWFEKAADAIENTSKAYQMMAEAYEAEVTKNFWIPVTERLPEEAGKYLVCGRWRGKQPEIWFCEFMALGCLKGWANNAGNPVVSHWMQLPEPPKEEE